jgi:hypothetical protein
MIAAKFKLLGADAVAVDHQTDLLIRQFLNGGFEITQPLQARQFQPEGLIRRQHGEIIDEGHIRLYGKLDGPGLDAVDRLAARQGGRFFGGLYEAPRLQAQKRRQILACAIEFKAEATGIAAFALPVAAARNLRGRL